MLTAENGLVAILSDFHLLPGHDESAKIDRLKKVYRYPKIRTVHLLGDTFELFRIKGTRGIDSHRRLTSENQQKLSFLKDIPTHIHPGNHDLTPWLDPQCLNSLGLSLVNADYFELKAVEKTYRLEHGHRCTFDSVLMDKHGFTPPLVDYLISNIVKFTHRLVGNHTGHRLFGHKHNLQAKKTIVPGANRIIGHTHCFEMSPKANFYNTGCNLHELQGLLINTTTGHIRPLGGVIN